MFKKRLILSVLCMATFLMFFAFYVSDHEICPNDPKRWHDTYEKDGITMVRLKTNGDYLNYSSNYGATRYNWNNYGKYVDVVDTDFSVSEVDYCMHADWTDYWPSNALGVTLARDADGNWWTDWDTLEYNPDCGGTLVYAKFILIRIVIILRQI